MAKLVFVVDNVAAVREALCEAFRTMYEDQIRSGELVVEGLPDGTALLARSAEAAPDLVFMDVDMPDPDGIETFYRFKQLHPQATRGVFFLTGLAGAPSTNQRLEQAVVDGAGGFMSKPTSAASLQAVTERLLFSR
ncbi:MAG TPA: response regulator [Thermoanaerobaculaceae bacterium]|nr:response regulator [Thermoanaerobaculaceae bacterium]HRS16545.1 response regulator [Thermoanaerobaculaceae bacterium]